MAYRGKPALPPEVRFSNKYEINEVTDCWEWTASTNNIGYGMFRWETGIMRTAHRVSYELFKGMIPKGKIVCHTCDNPKCVNPDHLWIGTNKDNYEDMKRKGRDRLFRPGSKQPIGICKHCGTNMPVNMLARYHNDKCKHKPKV